MTDADRSQISLAFAEITMALENAANLASQGQNPSLPVANFLEIAEELQTEISKTLRQAHVLRKQLAELAKS